MFSKKTLNKIIETLSPPKPRPKILSKPPRPRTLNVLDRRLPTNLKVIKRIKNRPIKETTFLTSGFTMYYSR